MNESNAEELKMKHLCFSVFSWLCNQSGDRYGVLPLIFGGQKEKENLVRLARLTTTQIQVAAGKHGFTQSSRKAAYFTQLFETACVRNLFIVKNLEHDKLCHFYFDHTEPCCKRLRQTSKIKKLQTSFRMVLLFQGQPLNNCGVECKL